MSIPILLQYPHPVIVKSFIVIFIEHHVVNIQYWGLSVWNPRLLRVVGDYLSGRDQLCGKPSAFHNANHRPSNIHHKNPSPQYLPIQPYAKQCTNHTPTLKRARNILKSERMDFQSPEILLPRACLIFLFPFPFLIGENHVTSVCFLGQKRIFDDPAVNVLNEIGTRYAVQGFMWCVLVYQ